MSWPNHSHVIHLGIQNDGYFLRLIISDTLGEIGEEDNPISIEKTALELTVRTRPTIGFLLTATGYNPEGYLSYAPQLFSDGVWCLEKIYAEGNGNGGRFFKDSTGYIIGPFRKRYPNECPVPRTYLLPPESLNTYADWRDAGRSLQHDIRTFRRGIRVNKEI